MILPLLLALYFEDVTVHAAAAPSSIPDIAIVEQGVGSLSVSISDQKLAGSVPRGAQRVPFLTINLAAGCDASVSVDSITVAHRGLGSAEDIRAVYLFDGSKRLTRAVRLTGKDQTANLRLRKFIIPECGAVSLSLLGDISQTASAAGEHAFAIRNAADISSSAYNTSLLQTSDVVTVETKPMQEGVISLRMLSVPPRVQYGSIAKSARFQISSDGKADHMLRSITLTNKGTARNFDLRANYLETSTGKRLTTTTKAMDLDKLTLTFDPPYLLERNADVVFVLRSEVKGSNKSVQFVLEEPSDLEATIWK